MISTRLLFALLVIYITSMIIFFRLDHGGKKGFSEIFSTAMAFFGAFILILLTLKKYNIDVLGNKNVMFIAKSIGIILSVLLLFIGLISIIFRFVKEPPISRAFFTVINIIIFSTTLLFILYLVKDYKFDNPYLLLIQNTIMYIPCLTYDLIDWIKYQYSITTPTAYIILGVDVGIILLNTLYQKAVTLYTHKKIEDGMLLEGPVFLNGKTTLGTFENMMSIKENKPINYHYGLSFEVYINPQPPSTSAAYSEYTVLFDYGGKPTLLYKADENKLKIQMKMNENETKNIYLGSDLKLQKWNKFIINYDGGILDIILNGKLLSSTSSVSPYMTLDVVSVGHNNGINGGIRNVLYFRKPII